MAPIGWMEAPVGRVDAPMRTVGTVIPCMLRFIPMHDGSRRSDERLHASRGRGRTRASLPSSTIDAAAVVLCATSAWNVLGQVGSRPASRAPALEAGTVCSDPLASVIPRDGFPGLPTDAARIVARYERICNASAIGRPDWGGDFQACAFLGLAYEGGLGGLPKDPARAVALYEVACERNVRGCALLGRAYANGQGGLPSDVARAVVLYEQGCQGGDSCGCQYLERACDSGSAVGCTHLALMYRDGWGDFDKDPARAAALFKRACDGGDRASCTSLELP